MRVRYTSYDLLDFFIFGLITGVFATIGVGVLAVWVG